MHRSQLDTLVWFWAAYLVSTQTTGISALELQKQLGIEGYETAFQLLHKLRGTDDGAEFSNLKTLGFDHKAVTMRGDKIKMDSTLPMISVVTANLKTWLDGTYHGASKNHLQAYLDELMFRFNRRFYRAVSFRSLLDLGILGPGMTYDEVYERSDATIPRETDIM